MWMCPWKVRVRRVGAVRSTKQEPARPERPIRVGHGVREQASHLVCRQMEERRLEIEALSPGEGCFLEAHWCHTVRTWWAELGPASEGMRERRGQDVCVRAALLDGLRAVLLSLPSGAGRMGHGSFPSPPREVQDGVLLAL